jgi:uncharacterized YkwD family protein
MITRRSVFAIALVATLLLIGSAVGQGASSYYGYSTFGTGAGSKWTSYGSSGSTGWVSEGGNWSGNWGWYRPALPSKPGTGSGSSDDPVKDPGQDTQPPPSDNGLTSEENSAFLMVNQERTSRNIAALELNMTLVRLARMKAKDMAENNYFDHISPTYGSPFEMLQAAGVNYKWAGENIARASSVTIAHKAFMESSGHRDNILSAGYTQIGVGVYRKGTKMYECQLFIKPR